MKKLLDFLEAVDKVKKQLPKKKLLIVIGHNIHQAKQWIMHECPQELREQYGRTVPFYDLQYLEDADPSNTDILVLNFDSVTSRVDWWSILRMISIRRYKELKTVDGSQVIKVSDLVQTEQIKFGWGPK